MSSLPDSSKRFSTPIDFGVEDPEIDFDRANNPSPMAKAIQMPLGNLWSDPWVNSIINAHNNEHKFQRKKRK